MKPKEIRRRHLAIINLWDEAERAVKQVRAQTAILIGELERTEDERRDRKRRKRGR